MGKAIIYFTNCHKNLKAKYLSLATDPAGAGLLDILCCLLCLLRSLVLDSRLLDGGFLLIFGGANCLLPLGFRTSGFWFLFAMMSCRVAPTTARWNFWARRVLFLVTSSSRPFLCFLR